MTYLLGIRGWVIVQRDPLLHGENETTKSLRLEEVEDLFSLVFIAFVPGGSVPVLRGEPWRADT